MDLPILIAIAASLFVIILSMALFFRSSPSQEKEQLRPAALRQRDGAPRRAQMARNRARGMPQEPQQQASEDEDPGEATPEISDKLGAKKRAKLEAKAEKKAQREAEEKMRSERRKKEEQDAMERKKLEELERAEEKRLEEEERKAREEKERKDHEEYLKMKEAFSVEEEGYEEGEQGDETNLLQEFVKYIKDNKVVVIEDLAAHFKLKTQSCIDRIKDLQKDEILSGVIDDRGKFIFVSVQEMEAVAKFIRQRGRVSIAELAENSNNLINLTPVVT